MKQQRRERTPSRNSHVNEHAEPAPEWGSQPGKEVGYNRAFGGYGSAARGWVDRPHDRFADLEDKVLREKFITESETEEEGYAGRGPRGYVRPDERIWEEVCEGLTRHPAIDASDMEVTVNDGEVTLTGTVPQRKMKALAEAWISKVVGVKAINDQVDVRGQSS